MITFWLFWKANRVQLQCFPLSQLYLVSNLLPATRSTSLTTPGIQCFIKLTTIQWHDKIHPSTLQWTSQLTGSMLQSSFHIWLRIKYGWYCRNIHAAHTRFRLYGGTLKINRKPWEPLPTDQKNIVFRKTVQRGFGITSVFFLSFSN